MDENELPTGAGRDTRTRPMARLALIVFGLALVVLAELVARGLAPRITGAPADAWVDGSPPPFVRSRSADGASIWTLHPAWRYAFPEQEFPARRPAGSGLVFCVGGSTVYGYPFAADFSFPARLQRVLAARHPAHPVTVVNAGGMSYGSNRLLRVVEQLTAYRPQLMVIYTGNNEFVEWDLGESGEGRGSLQRLAAMARRLVLVRSIEALVRPVAGAGEVAGGSVFGIDVRRREARVIQRQDRLLAAFRFRDNLVEMVRLARERGVEPILCTVGCNLSDWRPENAAMAPNLTPDEVLSVASHWVSARAAAARGDLASAAQAYATALSLDPEYAALSYEAARLAMRRGAMDDARRLFATARDHDPTPIRVLPELNRAIRSVAEEHGVALVDVERRVQTASPDGIPGQRSYLDYCHYNDAGHDLVALSVAPAVERALGLPATAVEVSPLPPAPPVLDLAGDNGFALWWLGNVELRQGRPDSAERLLRRAAQLKPDASQPLVGLAQVLQSTGRGDEALDLLTIAAKRAPSGELNYFNIVLQVALGAQLDAEWQDEAALAALERAVELDPSSGEAQLQLGAYHLRRKHVDLALEHLSEAARLHPNLAGVHRNLGLAQVLRGDDEAATRSFLEELRRHPFDERAAYRFAESAAVLGALPLARQACELALLLDPGSERSIELRSRIESAAGDDRTAVSAPPPKQ